MSVTFGTLICLHCSSKHRSLGVAITRTQSVQLDDWETKYGKRLINGTNLRFKNYLESCGIDKKNMQPKELYQLKAVTEYKKMVISRIFDFI